ncbi:MAG TPA: NADPH-dependent ferric siderophore reductase [Janthinobacterium sp.]|nr:NADPH-dependent ferric siderophore reductase [Janthinobacterium sp.]
MSIDASSGRVRRVRHEIKLRELTVVRVVALGPHCRGITFSGPSLSDFDSASFDDHVKFILDAGGAEAVRRDYTPRHHDAAAAELTLEFALHGDGPVATWAAHAAPGQRAAIAGPRSSLVIPLDYDWHLLAGDESAMPAIARRLEELPAGARAFVIAQAADGADRRVFHSAAALELRWVDDDAALLAAVRALDLPGGEGYAWCAGEAAAMAALRRVLVEEKGVPRHAVRAAAYWKRGASAHHENLAD